jgi:hypothetical protein
MGCQDDLRPNREDRDTICVSLFGRRIDDHQRLHSSGAAFRVRTCRSLFRAKRIADARRHALTFAVVATFAAVAVRGAC